MEKTYKCDNCNQEFSLADEVIAHIAAIHALHLPIDERKKWFEQTDNSGQAQRITEI